MVYIGVLGAQNVGKTAILKLFEKYIEEDRIKEVESGASCKILEKDFKGETNVIIEDGKPLTITITPNRIAFIDSRTGINHSIFAPGGHIDRNVVKMGIITVSRIVKSVVVLFAFDRPIKEQFEFFKEIRFFPKTINVCFNKFDLVQNEKDIEEKIKNYEGEIIEYFESKRIAVKKFYRTVAIETPESKKYNDEVIKMILDIINPSKKE
jgi:hypothetical protein